MQPPSLHRGRRKEAGQGICFAAGRAAVQRDSRIVQAIDRRGKETVIAHRGHEATAQCSPHKAVFFYTMQVTFPGLY